MKKSEQVEEISCAWSFSNDDFLNGSLWKRFQGGVKNR